MTLTITRWTLVSGAKFFSPFHAVFHTRADARDYARRVDVRDGRGKRIALKPVRVRLTMTTEDGA